MVSAAKGAEDYYTTEVIYEYGNNVTWIQQGLAIKIFFIIIIQITVSLSFFDYTMALELL